MKYFLCIALGGQKATVKAKNSNDAKIIAESILCKKSIFAIALRSTLDNNLVPVRQAWHLRLGKSLWILRDLSEDFATATIQFGEDGEPQPTEMKWKTGAVNDPATGSRLNIIEFQSIF
jgi:hypothetical protein